MPPVVSPGPEDGALDPPGGGRPLVDPAPAGTSVHRHGRGGGSFLRELPFLVVVALGLALLIKAFLVQAFFIPSGSMERTLHGCPGCSGDRVLVNKLVYHFRDVRRGEIVVFNGVDSWTPEITVVEPTNPVQRVLRSVGGALGVAPPGEEDFIKRVIGVPGDTVQCCDTRGRVQVNGVALHEPYVYQDDKKPFGPVKVPAGRLWVMGDHREFSSDSRAHTTDPGGGTIPENKVIGRAFVVVWPLTRVKTLPVPGTFQQRKLAAAPVGGAPGAARLDPARSIGPPGWPPVGLPAAMPVAASVALLRRRRPVRDPVATRC